MFSVNCQTQPLTERYIVELEQKKGSTKQRFTIMRDRRTFSGNPSVIAYANSYTESGLPPDHNPHKSGEYGVKTTHIESISWQWLYNIQLLVGYELILTTKGASLKITPYSWSPVEMAVTVSWLLQNYWNPGSPSFNPSGQQKASEFHPFATITMMFGSGNNLQTSQQQGQPSESSGQHAILATGYFTSLVCSDSGNGNGDPHQHLHSLGLNCFVQPCHGVCQFRSSTVSMRLAQSPLDSVGVSTVATPGQNAPLNSCNSLEGVASDGVALNSVDAGVASTTAPAGKATCNVIVVEEDGQLRQCWKVCKNARALYTHKYMYHSGQQTCELPVFGEDGHQQPCGKVFKHVRSLLCHKSRYHTGQRTCEATVAGEDGQQRPCGVSCKNARALTDHKDRYHRKQRTCDVAAIGEDGQPRPCGMVFNGPKALLDHKAIYHSEPQTCDMTVLGKDGKQRPCGTVCKNTHALHCHKSIYHNGQKTCDITVVGEDGHEWPCGKTFKHARSLSSHKIRYHTGEQTCKATVVGKSGQQRPCRTLCKNEQALINHKDRYHRSPRTCDVIVVGEDSQLLPCGRVFNGPKALSDHKRSSHSGPQTCEVTVTGDDSQLQLCGKVCDSLKALSNHKRIHRKRKLDDLKCNDKDSP